MEGIVSALIAGILAIQASGTPINEDKAREYAQAAYHHARRHDLDPFDLIGIARNESDFRVSLRSNKGLDCGITQIRARHSRYSCSKLTSSAWHAFSEAARMLKEFTVSCKGRKDFDRCRFNRYNAGWKFSHNNKYWLRVKCFARAARYNWVIGNQCRNVKSIKEINRLVPSLG